MVTIVIARKMIYSTPNVSNELLESRSFKIELKELIRLQIERWRHALHTSRTEG